MTRRAVVAASAVAAALAAGSAAFFLGVTAWPEIVTPAWFLSLGRLLYRDVFFPHTPLLIGTTALLGRLLGFTAPVLRLLVALPLAATGALVVARVRPRPRVPAALVAAAAGAPLAVLLAVYAEGPALWPEPALAPLFLAAALALERFERKGTPRALALGTLLLGTAVLVKQTAAWAGLAALLWLLLGSRRRSARAFRTLAVGIVAPYATFAVLWALAFRTLSHLRWTLVMPVVTGHYAEIGVFPGRGDLTEAIALFLPVAAAALLSLSTRSPGRLASPLPWVAIGAAGMAWPRFGLLHLAGTTGIGTLLLVRGVLFLAARIRRARRHRFGAPRLLAFAGGTALLVTALGIAVLGAGPLAWWGGPVHYWNDVTTRGAAESAAEHVRPGEEMLVFLAPYETLYPLLKTRFPGGLYVNAGFWYYLNKEGIDERVVAALAARPGLPVLYREPDADEKELRATALYRFLKERTELVEKVDERTSWRRVTGGATSASRAR